MMNGMSDDQGDSLDDESVPFDEALRRFESLDPHPAVGPNEQLPPYVLCVAGDHAGAR